MSNTHVYQVPQTQNDSFWRDQKQSVLRGEANYTYAVGPGYESIPISHIAAGYGHAFDDRVHDNAYGTADRSKNLPDDPANLYAAHRDMHTNQSFGYHFMSDQRIAEDMAPFQNNRKLWQVNQIGTCMQGLAKMEHGSTLVGTSERVHHQAARPIDPGLASGFLTDPPAPKLPAAGNASYVPAVRGGREDYCVIA